MCTPNPAAVAENVLPVIPLPAQVPPIGLTVNVTNVSVKHILGGTLPNTILGCGLTVMVKVIGVPVQVMPPLV